MIVYDFIRFKIMPLFVTTNYLADPDTAIQIFDTFFMIALSAVLIHIMIVLPYRGFLHLMRYHKWKH